MFPKGTSVIVKQTSQLNTNSCTKSVKVSLNQSWILEKLLIWNSLQELTRSAPTESQSEKENRKWCNSTKGIGCTKLSTMLK